MSTASARALLAGLVDYAGLFPPAALALPDAVAEHVRALGSSQAWLLGRFVVPAARLAELARLEDGLPAAATPRPWRLAALLGPDTAAEIEWVAAFNAAHAGRAVADSVELKARTPAELEAALAAVPSGLAAYVELPPGGDLDALLPLLRARGARAKLRSGGLTPEAIPPASDVARFLAACARAGVAWKATAGLHHAVRGEHALAAAPGSPRAPLHGFLNLFAAAAFARAGAAADELQSVLLETDPAAFSLSDEALAWRYLSVSAASLAQTRAGFALSFGSCSIEEPVADLRALGVIE